MCVSRPIPPCRVYWLYDTGIYDVMDRRGHNHSTSPKLALQPCDKLSAYTPLNNTSVRKCREILQYPYYSYLYVFFWTAISISLFYHHYFIYYCKNILVITFPYFTICLSNWTSVVSGSIPSIHSVLLGVPLPNPTYMRTCMCTCIYHNYTYMIVQGLA